MKMPPIRRQNQYLQAAREQRNKGREAMGKQKGIDKIGGCEEDERERLNEKEIRAEVHFLDFDSELEEEEEEEEYTDWEEEVDVDFSASRGVEEKNGDKGLLDRLKGVEASVFDTAKIRYSRGANLGERQTRRKRQQDRELRRAASGCVPLTSVFVTLSRPNAISLPSNVSVMPFDPQVGPNEEHIILEEVPMVQEPLQWVSENDLKQQGHEAAIKALKKKSTQQNRGYKAKT
ncbi:hypothetical protein L873DRAFT_1790932 [Choiromyces venosus 120613-1]|uniref:Uncharacterized protein n=1 Tax=Choiromyces venosus 120613-1 TaxID=1336337 RepID=A0A3N4JGS5_9PEZI|nr:hypothetical protein L873DRAFT_1790932 [Choiromyces venosus 120613-1]